LQDVDEEEEYTDDEGDEREEEQDDVEEGEYMVEYYKRDENDIQPSTSSDGRDVLIIDQDDNSDEYFQSYAKQDWDHNDGKFTVMMTSHDDDVTNNVTNDFHDNVLLFGNEKLEEAEQNFATIVSQANISPHNLHPASMVVPLQRGFPHSFGSHIPTENIPTPSTSSSTNNKSFVNFPSNSDNFPSNNDNFLSNNTFTAVVDPSLLHDADNNVEVQYELKQPSASSSGGEGTTIIIDVGEMKHENDVVTLYNDHFASNENSENKVKTPEKCSICLEQFPDYESFLFHVKEKHPIEYMSSMKLFKCPFCTYYSKSKTSVLQHVRTHTREKPFKCGVCGKSFNQKAGVQQHMRSHSNEKPFCCHICGRGFKAASTLQSHIQMRHERLKPYTCKQCGLSFGHSSNLRIHMRIHTGSRPFKCKFCGKTFTQQGHLRVHERLHTGDRPFRCQYCNQGFTHVGNLKQHIITQHTKEYPYICEVCGKGFIAPGDMKRHTKLHTENAI